MNALYPYQNDGAAWMTKGRHRFLADKMGLGKTPQAAEALNLASDVRSATIVCPAFLKENWRRELSRWSRREIPTTILSYDIAARDGLPQTDAYIFDEAHALKTPSTKRTKRLLGIENNRIDPTHPLRQARHVWPLSGTPMPNGSPGEVWPWLRAFGATELPYGRFLERYCRLRQTQWGPQVMGIKRDMAAELTQLMAPYFLRRDHDVVGQPVRWGELVLAPNVGFDDWYEGKILFDGELPAEEDEHLSRLRRKVGEAKAEALAKVLEAELESGAVDKLVVFGWHKSVLDILQARLARFSAVRCDGDTPIKLRQAYVDRFQSDPQTRVFIGNIQAAGTGLTLTAACHLVFAEMSWNPGDNAQAAMRIDRIGQLRPVLIRTAVLAGTLDEAVVRITTRKTRATLQIWNKETV